MCFCKRSDAFVNDSRSTYLLLRFGVLPIIAIGSIIRDKPIRNSGEGLPLKKPWNTNVS